jgi:hypothetical protein
MGKVTTLSKARAELLGYVLGDAASTLEDELAAWLEASPRFEQLLSANRDKVRKKLRTAGDDEALWDVRAELLAAERLVGQRRFEVELEAYGSGKRGPDLTVTFRANQRFNVEVTRLRPSGGNEVSRLQGVLLVKCRQLIASVPNVIALVAGAGVAVSGEAVAKAAKQLKVLADRKEEAAFIRRGYESARDFLGYFARLSAVLVLPDGIVNSGGTFHWLNPLARYPLPREIVTALARATDAPASPNGHPHTAA